MKRKRAPYSTVLRAQAYERAKQRAEEGNPRGVLPVEEQDAVFQEALNREIKRGTERLPVRAVISCKEPTNDHG